MTAGRRTALVLKREASNIPLPPGQVLGLVLDVVLERIHPTGAPAAGRVRRATGVGLVLAGIGLTIWALAERRRHTRGSFVMGHPERLVTSGPYASSRHPMYVGWWLIHAGVATSRGSAWPVVTMPLGMLVEHFGVVWEESMLLQEFGSPYADYQRNVPRYVGIWGRRRPPR